MSVEFGGGSAGAWSAGQATHDADRQVITNLYDTYAAHLFDYCARVLRHPAAAADAVQDTLISADALISKLRDPERLRVWLYTIARRQCLSELPRGTEMVTPDEYFADHAGVFDADTAEFDFPDAEAEARARETLLVLTAALDGLSGQDQEVVSLAFRHGIGGADLAAVLGVSGRRAQAMLSGASARFEESADAFTVLRAGWAACPALESIVGEWDPASLQLTPELRKRLSRHIGSCDNCTRNRGDIFGPELLGAVPLAVLPAALSEHGIRCRAGVLPPQRGAPGRQAGRGRLPCPAASAAQAAPCPGRIGRGCRADRGGRHVPPAHLGVGRWRQDGHDSCGHGQPRFRFGEYLAEPADRPEASCGQAYAHAVPRPARPGACSVQRAAGADADPDADAVADAHSFQEADADPDDSDADPDDADADPDDADPDRHGYPHHLSSVAVPALVRREDRHELGGGIRRYRRGP